MPASETKKTGMKGIKTEELVRRYFLQAGFYVCRGMTLSYDGDDITDIDVWIYERSATLARRRIIIDIKDKAKPQAAERMLFVLGLAQLIGVEGGGVATTDKRKGLRELARKQKLLWIDGEDIQRLKKSSALSQVDRISEEELLQKLTEIDKSRGPKQYLSLYQSAKSSLGDRFGVSSGNFCLDATLMAAHATTRAHPNSTQADSLCRLTYQLAGMCAASFDYASAETALRPAEERHSHITQAIKFGADAKSMRERVTWMEDAISRYAEGGSSVAKLVTRRVLESGPGDEARTLAEVITALSHDHRLFDAARGLEGAAFSSFPVTMRELSTASASALGAILDYGEIDRRAFAGSITKNQPQAVQEAPNGGTLL
ncbi:MAG: hypothetical protein AAFR92_08705 [Pseudomonadota bacterium]